MDPMNGLRLLCGGFMVLLSAIVFLCIAELIQNTNYANNISKRYTMESTTKAASENKNLVTTLTEDDVKPTTASAVEDDTINED